MISLAVDDLAFELRLSIPNHTVELAVKHDGSLIP